MKQIFKVIFFLLLMLNFSVADTIKEQNLTNIMKKLWLNIV